MQKTCLSTCGPIRRNYLHRHDYVLTGLAVSDNQSKSQKYHISRYGIYRRASHSLDEPLATAIHRFTNRRIIFLLTCIQISL